MEILSSSSEGILCYFFQHCTRQNSIETPVEVVSQNVSDLLNPRLKTMGLVVTTSQIRQVCTFRIKQMVSTISLPQIYFYSNLKKLLGNNLAQKGKKKMSRGNGGGCPQCLSSDGTAPSMIFKSRCYAVRLRGKGKGAGYNIRN